MSRGSRESTTGNITNSMRGNYSEYGVDEYYKKVGATYRNPHFPGIRHCLFMWLNKWWEMESSRIEQEGFTVFDMACGSGEVTISLIEWWKLGRTAYVESQTDVQTTRPELTSVPMNPRKKSTLVPPPLRPGLRKPQVLAADPYTEEAFKTRTNLECFPLSFREIADGALPPQSGDSSSDDPDASQLEGSNVIEMTICSFALHLIDSSSELFALLWELSTKCRWLIVLAPHKKPEIKLGWGWIKWDLDDWLECPMTQSKGEFLQDRVQCRVYRSINFQ